MSSVENFHSILNRCDLSFKDNIVSKEIVIQSYLEFLSHEMNMGQHRASFALHTGSICFDVALIFVATMACICQNKLTNEIILSKLRKDQLVLYENQRYRWKGIETDNDKKYMILEEDGLEKSGPTKTILPYNSNKHLVKAYYGDSQTTDGRGIRNTENKRERFLSKLLNRPINSIPTELDTSFVIVGNREYFSELCKNMTIHFNSHNTIHLLDIVPATYITKGGEEHQIGHNPAKHDAVIKITQDISVARQLALDKFGSRVIGVIFSGIESITEDASELSDLITRQRLNFTHVCTPIRAGIGNDIVDLYPNASIFACTKQLLPKNSLDIQDKNKKTRELHNQLATVMKNDISHVPVELGISDEIYNSISRELYFIRESSWEGIARDNFLMTAYGLLNLLIDSVFPMSVMDQCIKDGLVHPAVLSPLERIDKLWKYAEESGTLKRYCYQVILYLSNLYVFLLYESPKASEFQKKLEENKNKNTALIVPKAYYADVLKKYWRDIGFRASNIEFMTQRNYNPHKIYDYILVTGDFGSDIFDPIQNRESSLTEILLHPCELRSFYKHFNEVLDEEKRFYAHIQNIDVAKINEDIFPRRFQLPKEPETTVYFRDIIPRKRYFDEFRFFNFATYVEELKEYGDAGSNVAEVERIGVFTTGEKILFSKYYNAVVFNQAKEQVYEVSPDHLFSGDLLVFTKHDEFTQNIIDYIFNLLIDQQIYSPEIIEAAQYSRRWKDLLKEYKTHYSLSCSELTERLHEVGSSITEATVRQWIDEDSSIVGPRDIESLEHIAHLTGDSDLGENISLYFQAIKTTRSVRTDILKLITEIINRKLSGHKASDNKIHQIIYENIDKMSTILELEYIENLNKSQSVSINLVNRPILREGNSHGKDE